MSSTEVEREPTGTSLRELLAHYDRQVQAAFGQAAGTTTGTSRVQALHLLRRAISAHDSVVASTLCPLLQDLPGGPEVAERLRHGCEQRSSLLARFQSLSQGTEAHNVYPVFGAEIETILAELGRSFESHVEIETTRVTELLESAAPSVAPEVIAARMAIEASHAPARVHRGMYGPRRSRVFRAVYRGADRMHEWNDSHHGWPSAKGEEPRPVRPLRRFSRRPPSIPDLLAGYDRTVDSLVAELAGAERGDPRRWAAAYRLAAAIAVHDSILGGTLCRLLDAVPEGRSAASRLGEGCRERAGLLEQWDRLIEHSSPSELVEVRSAEADGIIEGLIASFRAHESHETEDVAGVVEKLRAQPWRFGGTGLVSPHLDAAWPNPEPAVLAAHMALWAEKAPTHAHPLLTRHPANRLLRNLYHQADRLRDWRRSRHGWPRLT